MLGGSAKGSGLAVPLLNAGKKQNNNQAENKRYRQQAEGKDDQVAVDVGHVGYFPMNM